MFGVGKLPEELRSQLESEGVIDLGENLAVIGRFGGSVPGLHSGGSISRTSGALVFTSQRVVAALAIRSEPAALAVDCRWAAHRTPADED